MTEMTGPELRRAVEWSAPGRPHALYVYTDANNKRTPEYAATHIRLSAFYTMLGESLDALAEYLESRPGFVSLRIERTHKILRPQVIAIFDRTPA